MMAKAINFLTYQLEELRHKFPDFYEDIVLVIPDEFSDSGGIRYRYCAILTPAGEIYDYVPVEESLIRTLQLRGLLEQE